MILQALNRYYDILAKDPESGVALYGYSWASVSFALDLSSEGELLEIYPLYESVQRGKNFREIPRRMVVPGQDKRQGTNPPPYFLCDRSTYVLGLSDKEGEYAYKRFDAFHKFNKALLVNIDSPGAKAVVAFLDKWEPRLARDHPKLVSHLEELLKDRNLVFMYDGKFVHDDPLIHTAWDFSKAETGSVLISQCLVSGELSPIAQIHKNSIKGIIDGNPTGSTLVTFNKPAYTSYNKEQSINSPTSEKVAFAYTTVLNHLLSPDNPNRKFQLGDTTVVYWAESLNPMYAKIFADLFGVAWNDPIPEEKEPVSGRDRKAEELLKNIAEKVKRGHALDKSLLFKGLENDTQFYVLGLAPNKARLSVRFFYNDPFYKTVHKIMAHYEDMRIVQEGADEPYPISAYQIINETVRKNHSERTSSQKPAPLLAGAIFRAILENTPYPAALYYAILNRIRADMDDKERRISKINYNRASIIKAYLTRKYRNQDNPRMKEALCMSLNEQSTNQAYLLGRLFAVLEIAQREAAKPAKLDATIKDRYFTAACATPATVFPLLLRLSQHHISKAEYGFATDRRIEKILDLLDIENDPIPAHLNLYEQGIFILGYYHQRAAYYPAKTNDSNPAETSSDL